MNGRKRNGRRTKFGLRFTWKDLLLYGFLFFFLLFLMMGIGEFTAGTSGNNIPISKLVADIKDKKIEDVTITDSRVEIVYKNGNKAVSNKEPDTSLYEILKNSGVDPQTIKINVRDEASVNAWINILSSFLPVILIIAFFYFIFRQARGAQENIFSFGSSRGKTFNKDFPKTTFADVAGVDEAKQELTEVVDFLKHPEKYRAMGARTPKGVLLVGPSGTGKTLLARAVAGEAQTPFISIAGSEFMEMLVGVGAARVRDLFATSKKSQPAIIFIDEIDAIGRQRGVGIMGGHDEREQTLNQILVEMDGFTPNEQLVVIAASVTGDTPVMIKKNDSVRMMPIGEFVDSYYQDNEEDIEKEISDVQTLGFEGEEDTKGGLKFKKPAFKAVRSVFRHKVKEIYEIEYLGGKVKATGNHSVFIQEGKNVVAKPVSLLKKGDVLVPMPYKLPYTYQRSRQENMYQYQDINRSVNIKLPVYLASPLIEQLTGKYVYAMEQGGIMSQSAIAENIGVSQLTVSHWQRNDRLPRAVSRAYFKHELPVEINVTPDLCRLLGYYTAEGYARKEVDFCFNKKEKTLIKDVIQLMELIFKLKPHKVIERGNAVNIVYQSRPLATFLISHCGKGAHNKHVPAFLFEAPREYFIEFLRGVFNGDGYKDKNGRGEITSVSRQLILELNWLCRLHGIKSYMYSFTAKEGRSINEGKALSATVAYRLGWGKMADPFQPINKNYGKFPRITNINKMPYDGYVYDLCGCENEAFFGGESPILLHNTNRPDILDPALVRPGRFDRRIMLSLPDIEGRKAILKIHATGKPFVKAVDWEKVARRTVGYSGADLENMLNEAAILAARLSKTQIDMKDIEEAATKVKLGPEKKRMQSEQDKKITAYHESGHAIVSYASPHADPVHRISIVGRGLSLGHTLIPPAQDRVHETKTRLVETIATMLGGRAAEELIFQEMTTGAADDIEKATDVARQMVIEYGMSNLGPISYDVEQRRMFGESAQISEEMQAKIDSEVRRIIDEGYKSAQKILRQNKSKLDKVAEKLLIKETLEGDEFEQIMSAKGGSAPASPAGRSGGKGKDKERPQKAS